MALAFDQRMDQRFASATGIPRPPDALETESRLNISVVFTSVEATLPALKQAGALASALGAHITLLVPEVVPYALPLSQPNVAVDWNERRLRVIADKSKVDTTVRVHLCRDRLTALLAALKPRSLVVLGGRRRIWNRWGWPSVEERLGKSLRRAGHEVIFCGTGREVTFGGTGHEVTFGGNGVGSNA